MMKRTTLFCVLAVACDRQPATQGRQSAVFCYPGDPSCVDPPAGITFKDDSVAAIPIVNETAADLVGRLVDPDGRRAVLYREGATETPLFTAGYPIYAQGIRVGSGTLVCGGIAPGASDLTAPTLYCRGTTGSSWSDADDLGVRAWLQNLAVDPADPARAIITYKVYETSPLDTSEAGLQQNIACFRRTWAGGVLSAPTPCPSADIVVGAECNDNDRCTTNDRWISDSICRGAYVVVDGCGDPSECEYDVNKCPPAPAQGTACNDGYPSTINDTIQGDGQCVGTPQ
jgi:hypothetical protein